MQIDLTPAEMLLWQRVKAAIQKHHGGIPMSDTACFAWIVYAAFKAIRQP